MGLLALVLTVSVAVAADVQKETPARAAVGDGSGSVCDAVRVFGARPSRQSQGLVFSSRTTPDIELRPRLRLALNGPHVVRLRVLTPRGFLYQEIRVPAGTPALEATTGQRPGDSGRDLGTGADPAAAARQPATPVGSPADARTARVRLPVAGTSITQSSIFGLWSVQPYLDDQPEPCGPATRFTITE